MAKHHVSKEGKRKISLANKGKHYSPKTEFQKGHLRLRTEESYKKQGEKISKTKRGIPHFNQRGENHPLWQGGISFEPYSLDWTDTLKKSVRERDRYICQLCFKEGYPVHHIDYNKKNCNPDNLITLCIGCNSKVNFNRKLWENYFKKLIAVHKNCA